MVAALHYFVFCNEFHLYWWHAFRQWITVANFNPILTVKVILTLKPGSNWWDKHKHKRKAYARAEMAWFVDWNCTDHYYVAEMTGWLMLRVRMPDFCACACAYLTSVNQTWGCLLSITADSLDSFILFFTCLLMKYCKCIQVMYCFNLLCRCSTNRGECLHACETWTGSRNIDEIYSKPIIQKLILRAVLSIFHLSPEILTKSNLSNFVRWKVLGNYYQI